LHVPLKSEAALLQRRRPSRESIDLKRPTSIRDGRPGDDGLAYGGSPARRVWYGRSDPNPRV